jgi:hypothetical protein
MEENGIAYSDFKLTLNRVIGGNAKTRRTPRFKLSKQIPTAPRPNTPPLSILKFEPLPATGTARPEDIERIEKH